MRRKCHVHQTLHAFGANNATVKSFGTPTKDIPTKDITHGFI